VSIFYPGGANSVVRKHSRESPTAMTRRRPIISHALLISSLLLTVASTAHANTYIGSVSKAEWTTYVPSDIDMFIALPDRMPEKPLIFANIHSCDNSSGGQSSYAGVEALRTAIDSVGYIMIISQQSRNG
jgi:hypothetical protein